MKILTRRSVIGGLAAAPGLGLTTSHLSAQQSGDDQDALDRIQEQGFARVGFSNFTPWGYVGPDSKLTGVEPTVVTAFLKSIGVNEIDGVLTQYVSIIPGLQAGRFDIIGAGMQIRPSRCKEIAFGNPEWSVSQAFVVQAGNPKGLTNLDEVIQDESARLGVVGGGAEREYAEINGVPDDQIVIFPDLPTAASGLKAGRVDVLMFSSVSVRGLLQRDNDTSIEYVHMSKPPLNKEGQPVIGYGAVGFRQTDPRLRAAWNDWLGSVKASGELLELLSPYGFTEADIPGDDITVDALCQA